MTDANPQIHVFQPDSKEHARLRVASELLNLFSNLSTTVAATYFDMGQDWKWTTILGKRPGETNTFQLISAAQQERILFGTMSDLFHVVRDLVLKYGPREP